LVYGGVRRFDHLSSWTLGGTRHAAGRATREVSDWGREVPPALRCRSAFWGVADKALGVRISFLAVPAGGVITGQ